jgi:Carboxymuconolactone decarboxylase family
MTTGGTDPVRDPTIPRISFEALPDALAQALAPRVERLGYLGEFFQCAANQPDALLAFMEYTEAATSALDDRTVQLIALTVASVTENAYERNQHERLSVRLGFGREWVRDVERLEPSTLAAPEEQVVQSFLLDAVPALGRSDQRKFRDLVECVGPSAALGVLLVAGRYLIHGLVVNTLALAPPVPSIFEDGFDGP